MLSSLFIIDGISIEGGGEPGPPPLGYPTHTFAIARRSSWSIPKLPFLYKGLSVPER